MAKRLPDFPRYHAHCGTEPHRKALAAGLPGWRSLGRTELLPGEVYESFACPGCGTTQSLRVETARAAA